VTTVGTLLASRARALVRSGASERVATETLVRELSLPRAEVERAIADAFSAWAQTTTSKVPVGPAPRGARAIDVLLQHKTSGTPRFDPLRTLSADEQARISSADRHTMNAALRQLERAVADHKLPFVPVFGYLSLRTRNGDVFDKPQAEVRPGKDVVSATLPGWDIGVVLSTLYRGRPEHPGTVAGLEEKPGAQTPGSLLKLPLDDADRLLARLFLREMVGEGDLRDRDATTSNGMYIPRVLEVQLDDGTRIPALVFVTNPEGAKNPQQGADGELSVGQLAYFMLGEGGFTSSDGTGYGGRAIDYWDKSYLALKASLSEPVNPKIKEAVDLARLVQQEQVSARALPGLLDGAFVPLDTMRFQKHDA